MMGHKVIAALVLFTAGYMAAGANAAEVSRGKALYENHCVGCHDDTVHKREAHKARNLADVQKYVQRWAKEMTLSWSADELNDVTNYVNDAFYKY